MCEIGFSLLLWNYSDIYFFLFNLKHWYIQVYWLQFGRYFARGPVVSSYSSKTRHNYDNLMSKSGGRQKLIKEKVKKKAYFFNLFNIAGEG